MPTLKVATTVYPFMRGTVPKGVGVVSGATRVT